MLQCLTIATTHTQGHIMSYSDVAWGSFGYKYPVYCGKTVVGPKSQIKSKIHMIGMITWEQVADWNCNYFGTRPVICQIFYTSMIPIFYTLKRVKLRMEYVLVIHFGNMVIFFQSSPNAICDICDKIQICLEIHTLMHDWTQYQTTFNLCT